MEIVINYRTERLGRSSAFIDGKKSTIKKAEMLVVGKVPSNIKKIDKASQLTYIV